MSIVTGLIRYNEITNFITVTEEDELQISQVFMENRSRMLDLKFNTVGKQDYFKQFLVDGDGKPLHELKSLDQIYLRRCNTLDVFTYPNFKPLNGSSEQNYDSNAINSSTVSDVNFEECLYTYKDDWLLNCSSSNIRTIEFNFTESGIDFGNISVANFSDNQIETIGSIDFFKVAKNIVQLDLRRNPIKYVSPHEFLELPLLRILLINYDQQYVNESVLSKILLQPLNQIVYINCCDDDYDCYMFSKCDDRYEILMNYDLVIKGRISKVLPLNEKTIRYPNDSFTGPVINPVTWDGWLAFSLNLLMYFIILYHFYTQERK